MDLLAFFGLLCHLLIFLSLFFPYIHYFNPYAATDRNEPFVPIANTGWQLLREAFQPQTSQRIADMAMSPLPVVVAVILLVALILPAPIYLALLLPIGIKWQNIFLKRWLLLSLGLIVSGLVLSLFWLLISYRGQDLHDLYQSIDMAFAIVPVAFLLSLTCCWKLLAPFRRSMDNNTTHD
jgi:hypothetical protein